MLKNRFMKYWTRTRAITFIIIGLVMIIAGFVVALLTPANAGTTFFFLCGVVIGVGMAFIIISAIWLIRVRGMTDDQAQAHIKQIYDERYHVAFSKATQISTLITVVFLFVCGVIFLLQLNQSVAGWLFMCGGYLLLISNSIITKIILRRS